jgi:uncharacterized protein
MSLGPVAVAVSGGVDSLTLATVAARALDAQAHMYHAISPAVPSQATKRVREQAERQHWRLSVIDAREFTDPDYVHNPVNRCFYCKTHLYDRIAAATASLILSGTNTDDLGDYRPGLQAAAQHAVRHPYVECGIDKQGVRDIARFLGLRDVAELPAAPCLSSRIETGIAIDPATLAAVDAAEGLLQHELMPATVRCRVRRERISVELDARSLARLTPAQERGIAARIASQFDAAGVRLPIDFQPYRMGSAFLGKPEHARERS